MFPIIRCLEGDNTLRLHSIPASRSWSSLKVRFAILIVSCTKPEF